MKYKSIELRAKPSFEYVTIDYINSCNYFFNPLVIYEANAEISCEKHSASEVTACCGTLNISLSAKLSSRFASGNKPPTNSFRSLWRSDEGVVGVLSPPLSFISRSSVLAEGKRWLIYVCGGLYTTIAPREEGKFMRSLTLYPSRELRNNLWYYEISWLNVNSCIHAKAYKRLVCADLPSDEFFVPKVSLTLPLVAASSAIMIFMVVVLPAPLCPSKPNTSPASTANERLRTATLLNFVIATLL
ncbi:hypothetical protein C0J52_01312 [Blattella germanica]|nr:hypothetical protein C0J52_01312 [Blattella germanica]